MPGWGPGGGAGVLVGGTRVGVAVGKITGAGVFVGGKAVGVSVGGGVSVATGVSVAGIVGMGVTVAGMALVTVANAAGGCSAGWVGGKAEAVATVIAATVSATDVSILCMGAAATAVPAVPVSVVCSACNPAYNKMPPATKSKRANNKIPIIKARELFISPDCTNPCRARHNPEHGHYVN